MNLPNIEINIPDDALVADLDFQTIAQESVAQAVRTANLDIHEEAELSLVLCGDAMIKELNAQWREKDKPTNVLSFPNDPQGVLLGDIIISIDTAKREASLENKTLEDHVSHLVIHGFLHLFGYDHETDDEALRMESLETEILNGLGISDPYADRLLP